MNTCCRSPIHQQQHFRGIETASFVFKVNVEFEMQIFTFPQYIHSFKLFRFFTKNLHKKIGSNESMTRKTHTHKFMEIIQVMANFNIS